MLPPVTAWCIDVFPCRSIRRKSAPYCIIWCMMKMFPCLRGVRSTNFYYKSTQVCLKLQTYRPNCCLPAAKMKGCLSCITCHIWVSAITEEKVDQCTVPMQGGIVERGETTPAWVKTNTLGFQVQVFSLESELCFLFGTLCPFRSVSGQLTEEHQQGQVLWWNCDKNPIGKCCSLNSLVKLYFSMSWQRCMQTLENRIGREITL